MKKKFNQTIEQTTIETLSHEGRGISKVNGKTTFIQGALPGEQVAYQLNQRKKDFDQGRAIEILNPSKQRVTPGCPHYDICGGCSLQHLAYEHQIDFKQSMLIDMLMRIGHVAAEEWGSPLVGDAWQYRHKARLSVRYVHKKETVLVGFRERHQSRYIADIDACPILAASVGENITALKSLLNQFSDKSTIAQIEIAVGDKDTALIFRNLAPLTDQDKQVLITFAKKHPVMIFLQPGNYESVSLLYPEQASPFLQYSLASHEMTYDFHPTDFTQINPEINAKMVDQALAWLAVEASDTILDLFCGLGNFSLPLAKQAQYVIGIEGSQQMVERAQHNASRNGMENTQFIAADLSQDNKLLEVVKCQVNKALIDPPRTGALEIVKQLPKLNIGRLVYVSCNPATLARDADYLVNHAGYRLLKAGIMDMFPQTSHVESMAVFERKI